jgi:hypothetical protein
MNGVGIIVSIGDHNDSMDVIRHDNPFIQRNEWEMIRDRKPTTLRNRTNDRVFEEKLPVVRANRDEVRASLSVVIAGQSDRASAPIGIHNVHLSHLTRRPFYHTQHRVKSSK